MVDTVPFSTVKLLSHMLVAAHTTIVVKVFNTNTELFVILNETKVFNSMAIDNVCVGLIIAHSNGTDKIMHVIATVVAVRLIDQH